MTGRYSNQVEVEKQLLEAGNKLMADRTRKFNQGAYHNL